MPNIRFFFTLVLFAPAAQAKFFDCSTVLTTPVLEETVSLTPTGDFELRDSLPETNIPPSEWREERYGNFGPVSLPFPRVIFPSGVDHPAWSRERLIAAARKWVGLPYAHYHIPSMGGLDCSNLTAWLYNYAFGIRFTSNVRAQAEEVGRRLTPGEKLLPGDLLFLRSEDGTYISHVEIFVDEETIFDASADGGVQFRPFTGKYKDRFAWARRIL